MHDIVWLFRWILFTNSQGIIHQVVRHLCGHLSDAVGSRVSPCSYDFSKILAFLCCLARFDQLWDWLIGFKCSLSLRGSLSMFDCLLYVTEARFSDHFPRAYSLFAEEPTEWAFTARTIVSQFVIVITNITSGVLSLRPLVCFYSLNSIFHFKVLIRLVHDFLSEFSHIAVIWNTILCDFILILI